MLTLVDLLRAYRTAAGSTQAELSEKLGRAQSFISDVERGQRRLDLVQLRDLVLEMGVSLPEFVDEFERRLARPPRSGKRS